MSDKSKREKIHEIYHGPVPGAESPDTQQEVVYGADDRLDYYEVDSNVQKIADSTVLLTDKGNLVEQEDGSYVLDVEPYTQGGLPACPGEKFGSQNIGGWCSGFMVGKDLIATAGHCGNTTEDAKNTAYIFGFRVDASDGTGTTKFAKDQVYFGKEMVAHELSDAGDYAVVRMDREITAPNASVLKVRASGAAGVGDDVGVIGYPSGLPVKVAFGAATKVKSVDDPWLFCNLDTYGGNSGSPVFNGDGTVVEGILVRGATDYVFETGCFKSNQMKDEQGAEAVTKAEAFVDKIPSDD